MLSLFNHAGPENAWLIAGLGNPGAKYDGTRHNTGFEALDALAAKWGVTVNNSKFKGLYGSTVQEGQKVYLLKPQTFMNLSGESVAALANFYKITADHVIVLCDDVDQDTGKLRIRPKGSAGGHNGLKSIIACLGSDAFSRVRIGVGKKPHPDYDLADWVLGKFSADDRKKITDRYPDIAEACLLIMRGSLDKAQNLYNH